MINSGGAAPRSACGAASTCPSDGSAAAPPRSPSA